MTSDLNLKEKKIGKTTLFDYKFIRIVLDEAHKIKSFIIHSYILKFLKIYLSKKK